jgi:hypothetical protein
MREGRFLVSEKKVERNLRFASFGVNLVDDDALPVQFSFDTI